MDFLEKISTQFNFLLGLEGIAVFFGVLQVILAYYNTKWNFVAGIISTAIFIYIFGFAGSKLYAEASLQAYYLIMSFYGLFRWGRSKNDSSLLITKTNKKEWGITFLISLLGTIVIYLVLKKFTDSNVPFWDAITAAIAWAGTWLMTKRKLEYWLVLNVSNLIAIPLFFYKELELTAVLTIILFIVAIFGYINWRKKVNYQCLPDSK